MKKKIFLFIVCGLLLTTLTGCSEEETKEEKLSLDNYNLTGTCWQENSQSIRCFADDGVYHIYSDDGKYITTNSAKDKAKLTKTSNTEGTFESAILFGYMVIIKDNKYKLWITYYDTIENKSITDEWEESSITLKDVNIIGESLLKANVLGKKLTVDDATLYDAYMGFAFSTYVLTYAKNVNANGNALLAKQENDGSIGMYYSTNNNYGKDEYRLCYSTNSIKANSNFKGTTREVLKEEREFTIDYCKNMK